MLSSHTWRTAENSAAYLLGELRPGMRLLDVGCGPGTITADLAALVAPGHVVGLEHAPGVLDQARRTAEEKGVAEHVEFVVGDVHSLDFPDDTFDVVHAHQVLQHVGDPVRALSEMRRVCKPGGYVAVRDSDYSAFFWFPESQGLEDWNRFYCEVARANGGEPNAGRHLKSWAARAGFAREDIRATTSTWCFSTDAERAWWGASWADRAVKSDFAKVAIEGGFATPEDLQRLSQSWRDWAADEDGWLCIPHAEILCKVV